MKLWVVILVAITASVVFLRAADESAPASLPASVKDVRSDGFSSEQYFEPPNEQKLKLRFSGASVDPLPDGLQEISQARIEMFNTNGLPRAIAETPKCEFSLFEGVGSSSGALKLKSADGKFYLEGDGFLWRQKEMSLVISNHVHTVLKLRGANFLTR